MNDEWPKPGDEVMLIRSPSGVGNHATVTKDSVERLTKRDVVLVSGERLRRDGLQRREGAGSWSGVTYRVVPLDDPDAARIYRQMIDRHARSKVRKLAEDVDRLTRTHAPWSEIEGAVNSLVALLERVAGSL